MKTFILFTVLSCAAMLEAASLFGFPIDKFDPTQIGSKIGSHIGKSFGRGVGLFMGRAPSAGGFNLGDNLGLGGEESQASNYRRGQNAGSEAYNDGASGAANQAAHDAGAEEFHNKGQHHHKTTSVSQSEDDGSQDVGGSKAHNVGAQSSGAFNRQKNGAAQRGNDYAEGAEQSDVLN